MAQRQQLLWERDAQRHAESRKNKQVEDLLKKEEEERERIKKMTAPLTDGAGIEWKWDKKTRWWWWRNQNGTWQSSSKGWTPLHARRQSDASSVVSETPCSSVSTAATLTLSPDEEKELLKLEKRRRDIAVLKERKANGEALNRYEESAIRSEKEIDYAPVMVKVRAFSKEQDVSLPAEEPASEEPSAAQAPVAQAPTLAAPVQAVPDLASSAQTSPEEEESPPAEHEITLSQMVATIRRELDLDDSLTMSEVIAEASRQVDVPATGTLVQKARSLFRELSST